MAGSLRQRGADSWELRVYAGSDPETRQRRYATRTVRGTRRAASRALAELGEQAGYARLRVGDGRRPVGAVVRRGFSFLVGVHRARDPQRRLRAPQEQNAAR